MANEPEDKKKPHRQPLSGRKAEKKAKKKVQTPGEKNRNPKAFAFNSAVRAERRFRRTQDIETKKQHVPVVDRTPVLPPPVIVAVVGPPKVGKSTLIQGLLKNFTRQPLSNLKGPVTIVSGKKLRLTIMECNNDINCMIDIAKVADLVLLLVDASFGFEMEIFEFLNICQVHGMPRIMGVLTHLDMLKHNKQLKRVKKTLKHRFWTEVYAGAKLFYLSGLIHGEYMRQEVKNLARYISVIKYRPLVWRTTHPYVLVDRYEDITSPEVIRQNPVVDREICLYGFVRGIPLNKHYSIHIPGCGDFKIKDVAYLPDPCPLPDKEKRRRLVEKERHIYAPFSGVGGIVYDKDAVYVELGGSHSHFKEEDKSEFVSSLMEVQEPLDKKIAHSELQLFSGAEPITGDDKMSKSHRYYEETVMDTESGRKRRKVVFTDDDERDEEESSSEETEVDGYESGRDDECEEDCEDSEFEEVDGNNSKNKVNIAKHDHERTYAWENSEKDDFVCRKDTLICAEEQFKKKPSTTMFSGKGLESNSSVTASKSSGISDVNAKLKHLMGDDEDEDDDIDEEDVEGMAFNDKPMETHQTEKVTKVPRERLMNEKPKKNLNITNKIAKCLANLENKPVSKAVRAKQEKSEEEENSDSGTGGDSNYENNSEVEMGDAYGSVSEDKDTPVEDSAVQWKTNLKERAASAFMDRQANSFSLWKLVYGQGNEKSEKNEKEEDDSEDIGGMFRKVSREQKRLQEDRDLQDGIDCSRNITHKKDWSNSTTLLSIADCFVTGKWKESEDAEELLRLDDASVSGDSEVYGDFEDLETGEKHTSESVGKNKSISSKDPGDSGLTKKEIIEKKLKLKEKFNAEYDEGEGQFSYYEELKQEVNRQAQLNKSEFEGLDDDVRVQLEGFRPGMYVRVELSSLPCEFVTNFDATYPLIIGGLLPGEENVGYVQVRMKKHRWFGRTLKNRDPLIVSLGWRRFQTLPIFAKLEDNLRHRMLKYTPEHIAIMGHFWGPITPQGTGFLAVQDVANKETGFRIAATGSVVELDKSVQVKKKLKLTGVPMKIHKKTAFIQGMFNSTLEVGKFEGAKLKTVSGIRGQIKKASGKPEGCFRATFEDKILMSDIVFCRTWLTVEIPQLYNPVLSLLLPPDQKNAWRGMKRVGELKRESGIRSEPAVDSLYTPVHREPRVFKPLVIPRELQKMLPYKDKPKKAVEITGKQRVEKKRIAVIHDRKEQKVAKLIRMLKTSYQYKQEQEKKTLLKKKEERKKQMEKEEMKLLKRHKEMKKRVFTELQKAQQRKKLKS